eukprot:CFRG1002T1
MLNLEEKEKIELLVKELTTTGQLTIDEAYLKELKKLCRVNDDNLRVAYECIWRQLCKDHAQIRYSSVQVIDVLFTRSHLFRQLLLEDVHEFFSLTLGLDPNTPLPKPTATGRILRRMTLATIKKWREKFHTQHRKLELGYRFLESNGGIDFTDLSDAGVNMSVTQRQREIERVRAERQRTRELYIRTQAEMSNLWSSIVLNLGQLNGCLEVIHERQTGDLEVVVLGEGIREGNTIDNNASDGKVCDLPDSNSNVVVADHPQRPETPDISPLLSVLIEHDRVLRYKHFALLETWIDAIVAMTSSSSGQGGTESYGVGSTSGGQDQEQILNSSENSESSSPLSLLQKCLELKGKCEKALKHVTELGIHTNSRTKQCSSIQESGITELAVMSSDSVRDCTDENSREMSVDHKPSIGGWSVYSYSRDISQRQFRNAIEGPPSNKRASEDGVVDPTAPIYKAPIHSTTTGEVVKIKEGVPVLPYDTDLEYWESKTVPINVGVLDDIEHRFWGSRDKVGEVDASLFRTRVRYHKTEFVPVKWACRAPLANGKLCSRHDRKRCPFHGALIPRDENGVPHGKTDAKIAVATTSTSAENTQNCSSADDRSNEMHITDSSLNEKVIESEPVPLWETVAEEMGIPVPFARMKMKRSNRAMTNRNSGDTTADLTVEKFERSHTIHTKKLDEDKPTTSEYNDVSTDKSQLPVVVDSLVRPGRARSQVDRPKRKRKTPSSSSNLVSLSEDIEVRREKRRTRLFKGRLKDAAIQLDVLDHKMHADKFGNQWQYY